MIFEHNNHYYTFMVITFVAIFEQSIQDACQPANEMVCLGYEEGGIAWPTIHEHYYLYYTSLALIFCQPYSSEHQQMHAMSASFIPSIVLPKDWQDH